MNFEQVISIVRQALFFGGGFLVAKGTIDSATLTAVVGAIVTLATSGWALYTRRNSGLVASAANVPSTQQITTTSATIANNSPSNVVLAK